MPIKFHCPTATCGKKLTVGDEAAGRTGKCPGCGNTLVVPRPEPEADEGLYDLESDLEREPEPEPEPEPVPRLKARAGSGAARAVGRGLRAGDPDRDAVGAKGPGGAVVSFEAVGLAWGLLKRRMGTWALAVLVLGVAQSLCQVGLTVVSTLAAAAEFAVIGNPMPISPFGVMAVGVMVQAVLFGGLYKMALKQIDGGEIGVGDVFAVGGVAPGLALAGLVTGVLTGLGFLFLIVPGLVFAALAMFTTPAVVDGLGAIEALKRSVGTLKRQWFAAVVFLLVTGMILGIGVLCLGFGVLVTLPLYVLAGAVQYRRSFGPGGVPRKVVVADPWAEAAGEPAGASGSGRVPAWAWGLLGLGVAMPVVVLALVAALGISAARQVARQTVALEEMQRQMAGFPGEAQDGLALRGRFQPPGAVPGMPPGMDPPGGPALAPAGEMKDPLQQALDLTRNGGARRPLGLRMLASLPGEDRRRADVVAALAPLLRDPAVGVDVAAALGGWAGPADVPLLVAGLDSDQAGVRIPLIRALGRLKAEAAIPALAEHLAVSDDRREAARSLQAIGPKAAPEVRKLLASDDGDTRREAGTLLRQLGRDEPGTQRTVALAALKSPDNGERERALQILARPPVLEDSRGETLAAALPLLQDPEVAIRRAALKVVAAWGTAEQVPTLIAVLDDPDREVKRMAIAALARAPDRRAALGLARLLVIPDVRKEAADALKASKPRDKEVEAEVRKALDNPDPAARQAACQVLGVVGTAASVPALKRAAVDRQPSVANAARAALGAIATPAKFKGNVRRKR